MAINPSLVIPPPNDDSSNGYPQLAAWAIVIVLMLFIARTKIGYTLLFYFCIASIIVVLAIGSPTIVNIFGPQDPQTQGT